MGRGNSHYSGGKGGGGGGGAKNPPPNEENGLMLYSQFIEGGSYEIHKLFGYDYLSQEIVSENSQAISDLGSVFKPAESDLLLYKGMAVTDTDLDRIRRGTFKNNLISSTSYDKTTAQWYANTAGDLDGDYAPLVMNIRVKRGTRVADTRKLLGENGMKSFEKEVTIWRNTRWNFSNLRSYTKYDDTYYTVDVVVTPN